MANSSFLAAKHDPIFENMTSTSEKSASAKRGLWRLLRIVLRTLLLGVLAWLSLALLWAFLPSPLPEREGDDGAAYASSVLRAGKTLTRVYQSKIIPGPYDRDGFALDYRLDVDGLALSIGGCAIPMLNEQSADAWADINTEDPVQRITVPARTGDVDGANLPWFPFADGVLLFWWIHRESRDLKLSLQWKSWPGGARVLEIHAAVRTVHGPLLAIEMRDANPATIVATVPAMPLSSSPTWTYPIRVAIIHVIAPTAVFMNDLLGNAFVVVYDIFFTTLFAGLVALLYGFMIFAVIFSLWRCLGGPSFENTMERVQGRLGELNGNERLHFLKLDVVQKRLDALCRNKRFIGALDVCRNGWHPEGNRAVPVEPKVNVATWVC